ADSYPLWLSGRARGINDIYRILFINNRIYIVRRLAEYIFHIVLVLRFSGDSSIENYLRETGIQILATLGEVKSLFHEHASRFRIAQYMLNAFYWEVSLNGHVSTACF